MIAFYIHTKGNHPFGRADVEKLENLRDDNPLGLRRFGHDDAMFKDLASQMLAHKDRERPYADQALQHPYFLSRGELMNFLEAVGNEPEIKPKGPKCDVSAELNRRHSLLPSDWKAVIGRGDLATLCKGGCPPRYYKGRKYTHCVRFIRNSRQHPKRPRLKGMGTASSLDEYLLRCFPALPLVVHQIIRKHPDWKARPKLKKFFP